MRNLGYATSVEDFIPNSAAVPKKVFSPKPNTIKSEKHEWEED